MNRTILYTSLILISFVLISCGSKVPIDDISMAVEDDRITGMWYAQSPDTTEHFHVAVMKFNRTEYLLYMKATETKKEKTENDTILCRAYIVNVGTKPFLNIQPVDTSALEERAYFFYDYRFLTDSLLLVRELNSIDSTNINGFETSEPLYHFIEDNLSNPALYGEVIELMRK